MRPKEELIGSILSDFVARVFNGSGKEVVHYLLQTGEISREELIELSRLPN
jgi:hypothetical protein